MPQGSRKNHVDVHSKKILEKGASGSVDVRLLTDPPAGVIPVESVLDLARQLAPGFYLDVGNVCNQRCLYCAVPREKLYQTSMAQAIATARQAVSRGMRTCIFIGGEPTIWPALKAAVPALRDIGIERFVLTTNGLMLGYPQVLKFLVDAGTDVVMLSWDDLDDEKQATLSARPDNPRLLRHALANLALSSARTIFYSVVTKMTAGRGAWMAEQIACEASGFATRPALIMAALKPVSDAAANAGALAISLTETAAEIKEAAKTPARSSSRMAAECADTKIGGAPECSEAAAQAPGRAVERPTFAFRDVPLCLVTDILGMSLDVYHRNAAIDLTTGELVDAALAADRRFVRCCDGCGLKAACPGVYRDYVARFGEGEFHAC